MAERVIEPDRSDTPLRATSDGLVMPGRVTTAGPRQLGTETNVVRGTPVFFDTPSIKSPMREPRTGVDRGAILRGATGLGGGLNERPVAPIRAYPGDDPLSILSDLYLRTFGAYDSQAFEPSYSVVPQVLEEGSSGSQIGLILLVLVGAGAAVYYFYFHRR